MLSAAVVRRFVGDEAGATVIEYVMIAAFVSLAIFTALSNLGSSLSKGIADIATSF
jgi:Flp pilus assembly pilin Flp